MGLMTALKSMLPWLQNNSAPWLTDAGAAIPGSLDRSNYWQAYEMHSRTRACIDRIADAIASLPLRVEVQRGEDWEEVDNELAALLDFVNPRQDKAALLKQTVIALLLYGNAYWALERLGGGRIQEI